MKNILFFFVMLAALHTSAQKVTYHTDDTLRVVDPANPNRQFIAVHNYKGNITAQGTMLNGKREGLWRL
ncbi:hypothetical protein BH11BAC1_BH11BAC1_25550 [soil metagenome]